MDAPVVQERFSFPFSDLRNSKLAIDFMNIFMISYRYVDVYLCKKFENTEERFKEWLNVFNECLDHFSNNKMKIIIVVDKFKDKESIPENEIRTCKDRKNIRLSRKNLEIVKNVCESKGIKWFCVDYADRKLSQLFSAGRCDYIMTYDKKIAGEKIQIAASSKLIGFPLGHWWHPNM